MPELCLSAPDGFVALESIMRFPKMQVAIASTGDLHKLVIMIQYRKCY